MSIPGTYRIKVLGGMSNNKALLDTKDDGTWVGLQVRADKSDRQVWEIELIPGEDDQYYIKVKGTLTNPRKYLSYNGKNNVDMWERDDKNGRQRWVFSKQKGGYYHIKCVAYNQFLTAWEDGKGIGFSRKDDGSGRQRWLFCDASVRNWMHDNLSWLGKKKLIDVCMPASHDAAMGVRNYITPFAAWGSTQTQLLTIREQLEMGVRYFDIRPSIRGGQYYSSHVTKVQRLWDLRNNPESLLDTIHSTVLKAFGVSGPVATIIANEVRAEVARMINQITLYQGGDGQSMLSIINDVNDYTAIGKDLVILNLSNTIHLDADRPFVDADYAALWDQLTNINHLLKLPSSETEEEVNLNHFTMNRLIGNGPTVILRVDNGRHLLGNRRYQGFFSSADFPISDYYDNVDPRTQSYRQGHAKMVNEQQAIINTVLRLIQDKTSLNLNGIARMFEELTIEQMSEKIRRELYENVVPKVKPDHYPNFINCDFIINENEADVAMAVNRTLHG